jgi:hypothetical protein
VLSVDNTSEVEAAVSVGARLRAAPSQADRRMTIDLVALRQLEGGDVVLLGRYLPAIEVERGDLNGRVLTICRRDAMVLAIIRPMPSRPGACPPRRSRHPARSVSHRRPMARSTPHR